MRIPLRNPTKLFVVDNRRVARVDENDFKEFVSPILSYPVRVQHLEVGIMAGNALFGHTLGALAHRDFANTHVARFALHVDFALT